MKNKSSVMERQEEETQRIFKGLFVAFVFTITIALVILMLYSMVKTIGGL